MKLKKIKTKRALRKEIKNQTNGLQQLLRLPRLIENFPQRSPLIFGNCSAFLNVLQFPSLNCQFIARTERDVRHVLHISVLRRKTACFGVQTFGELQEGHHYVIRNVSSNLSSIWIARHHLGKCLVTSVFLLVARMFE